MGNRHKAREHALQILYQWDMGERKLAEILPLFWKQNPAAPEVRDFAVILSAGVVERQEAIDAQLESHSTHWKLSRMSYVDRNILRIAVYELLHCADIPASVSLNEAIELGKKFGSEDSGAFINGVLDHIAKEVKV